MLCFHASPHADTAKEPKDGIEGLSLSVLPLLQRTYTVEHRPELLITHQAGEDTDMI